MTCGDCIHYEICKDVYVGLDYIDMYLMMKDSTNSESWCGLFKDKSKFKEVVHGEWIWDGYYKCSNCGNRLEYNKYIDGYKFKKFCDECGAKMDGEHNE